MYLCYDFFSSENKYHSLPLFGHFCCRLAIQPECINKEMCMGNVKANGQDHWARLQGFCIKMWESKKHAEEGQNPEYMIPINKVSIFIYLKRNCSNTIVLFYSNNFSICLQRTLIHPSKTSSKEFLINNSGNGMDKLLSIKFESKEEAQKWSRFLSAHISDHSRWKHAVEVVQRVSSIESTRNSFISNKRQGSLYDETPLIGKCTNYM